MTVRSGNDAIESPIGFYQMGEAHIRWVFLIHIVTKLIPIRYLSASGFIIILNGLYATKILKLFELYESYPVALSLLFF